MNTRRKLLLVLSTAALPTWAGAQQSKVLRVGWISNDRGSANAPMFAAFREGLRDLGYVEGRNLIIDARWGEGSSERLALSPQCGFASVAGGNLVTEEIQAAKLRLVVEVAASVWV